MIETILWDFDGVIAESVDVKGEAFREMYLKYGVDIADKVLDHHNNLQHNRIEHENVYVINLSRFFLQ